MPNYVNAYTTTLDGAVDSDDTTFVVNDSPPAQLSVPFRIRVKAETSNENEICLVTAIGGTGNKTWTVTRAYEAWNGDQTATAHSDDAVIEQNFTAGTLSDLVSELSDKILVPSSDTYINSEAATTNGDSATALFVGSDWGGSSFARFALLTFNISELAGKTIGHAELVLTRIDTTSATGDEGRMIQVRRCLRAYVPTEVTWNVYSTGNNWSTAGARSDGNDRSAIIHGGVIADPGNTYSAGLKYHLPVTDLIKESLDAGETTLRILVGANTGADLNRIEFASLEHATAAYRPRLYISGAGGAGAQPAFIGKPVAVAPIVPMGSASEGTNNTADIAWAMPITIFGSMQVRGLYIHCTTDNSGSIQWGLFDYSSSVTSATKLAGGSGSPGGTGYRSIAATNAPIAVSAGAYMLVIKFPAANVPTLRTYTAATPTSVPFNQVWTSYTWDDTPDFSSSSWGANSTTLPCFLEGDLDTSGTRWI